MTRELDLERCYHRLRNLLGDGSEPFGVVEAGEQHRQYWKPSHVRVLLIAESHVYTKAEECVRMTGAARFGPEGIPDQFIRLVYCLGYGEPSYIGSYVAANPGTWQYWQIFFSCVNSMEALAFASVLKRNSPAFEHRLRAQIDLLQRLKEMGVWLIDASLMALYTPGGGKPPPQIRGQVLRACWDDYISGVVSESAPRKIIVIGQEVARILAGRLNGVTGGDHITITQPQGLRSSAAIAEAYRTYRTACRIFCDHIAPDT